MAIISKNLLINEAGPKNNPREEEFFLNNILFIDPEHFCNHIKWEIYGDVPKGITIDKLTGKISGNIKWFQDQPSCQDNYPLEELNYDGSNWMNDGRFKPDDYDFEFTVIRYFFIKPFPLSDFPFKLLDDEEDIEYNGNSDEGENCECDYDILDLDDGEYQGIIETLEDLYPYITIIIDSDCDYPVKLKIQEKSLVSIKEVKCNNLNNKLFIKRYLESTKTSPEGDITKINIDGKTYTKYNETIADILGPFTCQPK